MNIIRWAAAAVTGLFVLMNLGAAIDPTQADWVRIASAALGIAGAVAAVGLASNRAWGRPAVIAVGALNVCDAVRRCSPTSRASSRASSSAGSPTQPGKGTALS